MVSERSIEYIFVKSELGAGTYGASLGIEAILLAANKRNSDLLERFPQFWIEDESRDADAPPFAHNIHNLIPLYGEIGKAVAHSLSTHKFPIVLAGDHANAFGTLCGIREAYPDKRIGVIWVDAHGDLNTPYTTPSGNMHGMPLAAALGQGLDGKGIVGIQNPVDPDTAAAWERLCRIGGVAPKLRPEDIVLVGSRDLDDPEWALVRQAGIKHFTPEQITLQGVIPVAQQTLQHLNHCDYIYVSFDVDCLDEAIVYGTGTPTPGGLSSFQAVNLLQAFWTSPKLLCMEFCEINPLLDYENQTAEIVVDILQKLLGEEKVTV